MHNTQTILQVLARRDPDYAAFASELPPALATADAELPPALAADILTLLRPEYPELARIAEAGGGPVDRTFADPLVAGGFLVAALFLLRSFIKIKRSDSGKWTIHYEHKPMDNDLLKTVIDALKGIFDKI